MKLSDSLRLLLASVALAPWAAAAPTERVADYEAALARAKATGNDIAVLQYGSDWSPASMSILENVWKKDSFPAALGDGFILLAADYPEVIGGRAVYGRCTTEYCGLSGLSETAIGSAPPLRLEKLAKDEPPAGEVSAVTSEGGVPFVRRDDGAWKVDGVSAVPGQDTLTLTVSPKTGGRYLRLDFPVDKSISGNGPGTAGGYFMLSRLTASIAGRTLKPVFVSDSGHVEGRSGAEALDGKPADHHGFIPPAGKNAALVVDLGEDIRAGATLTVKLIQNDHPRAAHLIASVRAAVVKDKQDARKALAAFPESEIRSAVSEKKIPFIHREDGTFIARYTPNPANDTLVLRMKTGRAGKILRLDFPTDPDLPQGGPGRAPNGNAAITEVEVLRDGAPLKTEFAWGNANLGGTQSAWVVADGVTDKPAESWNISTAALHERRALFVALKDTVPAGANLTVRVVCKSQWGQHTPGCVRAAMISDSAALEDIRTVVSAQLNQYRNRGFTWNGGYKMPRIALMDKDGRPVAADPAPRSTLTTSKLVAELKAMRAKREKRDALWAKAESAKGPAKAELLRQGLDAFDIGRDPEFGRHNGWGGGANGPFEAIHKAMREADPKDESGAVRWLGFSQGCWGGVAWAKENQWWTKLAGKTAPTAADYDAAEACIDRELADPRNRLLEHDHIQHIMKARYDLYIRKLKGDHTHKDIIKIQQDIAKVDPDTFWGVGAIGYIGMLKRGDNPFVCYGFDGNHQLKPGANAWTLTDGWMQVDHAGPYKFSINYGGGKDTLKVRRVAVLDGTREIGSGAPAPDDATLGAVNRRVEVPLEVKSFRADAKPVIRIEYEARPGALDVAGAFAVEPLLIEE